MRQASVAGAIDKIPRPLQAIVAAVLVPFIVTGFLRINDAIPTSVPFLILGAVALYLIISRRAFAIGVGILIGLAAWELVLFLVISAMGQGISRI